MKKIILIPVFLLIMLSCNHKKVIIDDNTIDKLAAMDYEIPSKYARLNLFVLNGNGEIIETSCDNLHYVFTLKYSKSYSSFKDFLKDVLNFKKTLSKSDFDKVMFESYILNKKLQKEFEDKGAEVLLSKYLIKSNNISNCKTLIFKDINDKMTFKYLFYINSSYVNIDEFGCVTIIKRDNAFLNRF